MGYGFWDRIAHVDLSRASITYEQPGEVFYRQYMGGGAIGSYYVIKEVKPGTDPFSADNVLVYSTSVVTGAPVPGFARHSVTSLSPLTGGLLDSEAGMRALNYSELVEAVNAVTGWETSLWELMKVGEKRLNMMRVYNIKSGIDAGEDRLPDKMFRPLLGGINEGKKVDREEFAAARNLYYRMSGWDGDGKPEVWKLRELDWKG